MVCVEYYSIPLAKEKIEPWDESMCHGELLGVLIWLGEVVEGGVWPP